MGLYFSSLTDESILDIFSSLFVRQKMFGFCCTGTWFETECYNNTDVQTLGMLAICGKSTHRIAFEMITLLCSIEIKKSVELMWLSNTFKRLPNVQDLFIEQSTCNGLSSTHFHHLLPSMKTICTPHVDITRVMEGHFRLEEMLIKEISVSRKWFEKEKMCDFPCMKLVAIRSTYWSSNVVENGNTALVVKTWETRFESWLSQSKRMSTNEKTFCSDVLVESSDVVRFKRLYGILQDAIAFCSNTPEHQICRHSNTDDEFVKRWFPNIVKEYPIGERYKEFFSTLCEKWNMFIGRGWVNVIGLSRMSLVLPQLHSLISQQIDYLDIVSTVPVLLDEQWIDLISAFDTRKWRNLVDYKSTIRQLFDCFESRKKRKTDGDLCDILAKLIMKCRLPNVYTANFSTRMILQDLISEIANNDESGNGLSAKICIDTFLGLSKYQHANELDDVCARFCRHDIFFDIVNRISSKNRVTDDIVFFIQNALSGRCILMMPPHEFRQIDNLRQCMNCDPEQIIERWQQLLSFDTNTPCIIADLDALKVWIRTTKSDVSDTIVDNDEMIAFLLQEQLYDELVSDTSKQDSSQRKFKKTKIDDSFFDF